MFRFKLLAIFVFISCNIIIAQYIQFVNPFIGTGGHGHTFPGPCNPFGMVQLSPDTRLDGWDGCSGYHYSDSIIYGFSHTHLSGTGIADYCDILIMPGNKELNSEIIESKYNSSIFNKKSEIAQAGLYSVYLQESKTEVCLTTSPRTGIHEYTFNTTKNNWILIDLKHRDKLINAGFDTYNKNEINGHRVSSSWAKEQSIFFSLKTSTPVSQFYFSSDSLKLFCLFENLESKKLIIQCAISSVDLLGAQNNLNAEWVNFNFAKAKKNCEESWNKMLSRIQVDDTNKINRNSKIIFYTSIYHTLIHPSLYQDADNRYRGMDNKIHLGKSETPRYTVFSLWDTYRAAHPFYQLVYPEYNYQFAKTFLEQYKECGRLPVWELSSNETYCMIGNHSIPVLVNAYLEQSKKFPLNKEEVLNAINGTLDKSFSNINEFKNGFISMDKGSESVSKTIENSLDYYAYNLLLNRLGNEDSYYQNLFNPESGFFQAKSNSRFNKIFNPYEVNFNYTEANAWQYLFGAHHDIQGMIECFAREENSRLVKVRNKINVLEKKLDLLFGALDKMSGREQPDITGLIGQYAHGNEPSHHVAYLYNYCNRNDKTQKYVKQIMNDFYKNEPDGLCGNEDCGQMSAWYVFSALGFYPVNPVHSSFQPGIPQFSKVVIHVPDSKKITIMKNNSKQYVNQLRINNNAQNSEFKIKEGDVINFETHSKNYLNLKSVSKQNHSYLPLPYVIRGDQVFDDSTFFEIKNFGKSSIQISHDSLFDKSFIYTRPIKVKSKSSYYFRIISESKNKVPIVQKVTFSKRPVGFNYSIDAKYDAQYSAGGDKALFDGLIGSLDFRDGMWQGYFGQDLNITIQLQNPEKVNRIRIRCLQDQNSWIFLPSNIKVFVSPDGNHYNHIETLNHSVPQNTSQAIEHIFVTEKIRPSKFIKLKIINSGVIPYWHISAGNRSWIFLDEILID